MQFFLKSDIINHKPYVPIEPHLEKKLHVYVKDFVAHRQGQMPKFDFHHGQNTGRSTVNPIKNFWSCTHPSVYFFFLAKPGWLINCQIFQHRNRDFHHQLVFNVGSQANVWKQYKLQPGQILKNAAWFCTWVFAANHILIYCFVVDLGRNVLQEQCSK